MPEPRTREHVENGATEKAATKNVNRGATKSGSSPKKIATPKPEKTPEERAAERERQKQRRAEREQAQREREEQERAKNAEEIASSQANFAELLKIFEPLTTSRNDITNDAGRVIRRLVLGRTDPALTPRAIESSCAGFTSAVSAAFAGRWDDYLVRSWLPRASSGGILRAAREHVAERLALRDGVQS